MHLLVCQKPALLGHSSDAKYSCWCARNQLYLITTLMQSHLLVCQKPALLGHRCDAKCICNSARNQLYLVTTLMQSAPADVAETSFTWSQL